MTHTQVVRAVARATGEAPRTIRRLGFQVERAPALELEPEDLRLVVACPFCGHPAPLPVTHGLPLPALAECKCDVEFDLEPTDIAAIAA